MKITFPKCPVHDLSPIINTLYKWSKGIITRNSVSHWQRGKVLTVDGNSYKKIIRCFLGCQIKLK